MSERCPMDHTPNEETRRAMRDADEGRNLIHADTMEELFRGLDADDAPSGGEAER